MLNPEYVQSIVTGDNLVVRNLQVTQGYYRLSQGMRRCIGGSNISWCTFATHASKTAGQALRHELMPRLLRSTAIRRAGFDDTFQFLNLGLNDPDRLPPHQRHNRLGEALRRLSALVSDGNITVFEELATPFSAFITTFRRDWSYDAGKLQAFLDEHLRPGPLETGGQAYLAEAFTAYYQARFCTQPREKAQLVLIGNLLVGLHEQTRLQPQIEQALTVPLDLFSDGAGRQNAMLRQLVSRSVTQMMMLIVLPSREMRLSQDVVAPTGVVAFPQDLIVIENARCLELVRQFESRHDTLTGSAARDWSSLDERMRFVVGFFRSHQQYKRMWEAPFTPEQAQAIESGHFPAGPL